ncbi:MAG: YegS/Rv2252/BmrU family lipid kinase [Salinivirgaceae bacterium]|nr:YegS/Rv2252/BmrU family lipid kinase [Salinivirgaceae bacterium]
MKKKIAFVVRGNLTHPDKFRANISKYFQSEFEVFLKFTRRGGHAIELVQDLVEHDLDYLIGVGGDGTFSELVNGYMLAPEASRRKTVLAAFPRGSGNDFSRTVGKINSMEHLYELIQKNETRPIDIVEVKFEEDGDERVRYYDNSFDIGLGGLVCQFMNNSGKTWGSTFTYFYNILRSFFLFKRIPIELKSANFNFKGNVLLLALNNGVYFGSGLGIAPKAKIDDGKVNLVIARNINIVHFLFYIPWLRRSKIIKNKELIYGELSECEISSSRRDCPIEMDGEVIGNVPLKVKVLKHAAQILRVQ